MSGLTIIGEFPNLINIMKRKKIRWIGCIISTIALSLILLLPLISYSTRSYFWVGGDSSKKIDGWIEDSKFNDEIVIVGRISAKQEYQESLEHYSNFRYRFKGSKYYINSNDNIGNEGHWVQIKIRNTTLGPECEQLLNHFSMQIQIIIYYIFSILLLLIGIILIIFGSLKPKWKYDPEKLVVPL